MKVIVAGLPKTGTKSVTAALKILGYEVYDFFENIYYLENEWYEIFQEGFTTEKFYNMYKDVDATIDIPVCCFWEEIHRAFPDAKVILTVRDSDEQWITSLKRHVHLMDDSFILRILAFVEYILHRKLGKVITYSWKLSVNVGRTLFTRKSYLNESISKMLYRSHNAQVIKKTPQEKLLVFNCKEGWEPLCKFLDGPIPERSFPRENVRSSIVANAASNKYEIVETYKKEIFVDLVKLILKIIFVCSIVIVVANLWTSA